jgi:hypothetical protein
MGRKMKLKMTNYEPDFEKLPRLKTPAAEMLNDPSELFLYLTAYTVPHGGEAIYYGEMLTDLGFKRDPHGNWWMEIATSSGDRPTTCFMCHLDTADHCVEPIVRVIDIKSICGTDGKSILGADDRAGLAIMLHMCSRDVPGLYYLFAGEESGCVGSRRAEAAKAIPDHIERAISFDRKGKTSVITHQMGTETCSDEFAWSLSNALNAYGLNYSPDPGGTYTDSNEFRAVIPECTNLSVGYERQHSTQETQDLTFLGYLAQVCCEIDWEGLPTVRTPKEDCQDYDYDEKSYYSQKYAYGDWNYEQHHHDDWFIRSVDRKPSYEAALEASEQIYDEFRQGHYSNPATVRRILDLGSEDAADMISTLLDDLLFLVKETREEL